jgi:hypothetical protein
MSVVIIAFNDGLQIKLLRSLRLMLATSSARLFSS